MKWVGKNKIWILNNLIWGGMAAMLSAASLWLASAIHTHHGWLALCGEIIVFIPGCIFACIALYAVFVLVLDFAVENIRKLGMLLSRC